MYHSASIIDEVHRCCPANARVKILTAALCNSGV